VNMEMLEILEMLDMLSDVMVAVCLSSMFGRYMDL